MNKVVEVSVHVDAFLEHVKAARNVSAVLKAKLITVRNELPDALVFVFEGDDDKIIYGQWIRRIRPDLRYEPFPCGGKKKVRALKNALSQDLSGLEKGVYFFIDRDFDDLNGFIDNVNLFMTETYSVENCIVTEEVLEEVLRDEFPCHSLPSFRRSIVEIFNRDYEQFLVVTSNVNRRIYFARRIPIGIMGELPTRLSQLAMVEIGNVQSSAVPLEQLIVLDREPTPEEHTKFADDFASLDPRLRFRGKFALKFFKHWLEQLANKFDRDDLALFGDARPAGAVRRGELVLSNFSAKSIVPDKLPAFLAEIVP